MKMKQPASMKMKPFPDNQTCDAIKCINWMEGDKCFRWLHGYGPDNRKECFSPRGPTKTIEEIKMPVKQQTCTASKCAKWTMGDICIRYAEGYAPDDINKCFMERESGLSKPWKTCLLDHCNKWIVGNRCCVYKAGDGPDNKDLCYRDKSGLHKDDKKPCGCFAICGCGAEDKKPGRACVMRKCRQWGPGNLCVRYTVEEGPDKEECYNEYVPDSLKKEEEPDKPILKPCPHCGFKKVVYFNGWKFGDRTRDKRDYRSPSISCEGCGCGFTTGSFGYGITDSSVMRRMYKAWNRRWMGGDDTYELLSEAARQYKHNDGNGFVFGYDKELVDALINKLVRG